MAPAPNPFGPDPQLVALVTGVVSGLVSVVLAKFAIKKVQAKVQPELQEQITSAVDGLLKHYQEALKNTKDRYEEEIVDLTRRLDRQERRIRQLMAALTQAGIAIPDEE